MAVKKSAICVPMSSRKPIVHSFQFLLSAACAGRPMPLAAFVFASIRSAISRQALTVDWEGVDASMSKRFILSFLVEGVALSGLPLLDLATFTEQYRRN